MICKRQGCCHHFKGSKYFAHVIDERKLLQTSGHYDPNYKGYHWECWCADCYAILSAHEYTLVYYVENRELKQKRIPLPKILPSDRPHSVSDYKEQALPPLATQIPVEGPVAAVKSKAAPIQASAK